MGHDEDYAASQRECFQSIWYTNQLVALTSQLCRQTREFIVQMQLEYHTSVLVFLGVVRIDQIPPVSLVT